MKRTLLILAGILVVAAPTFAAVTGTAHDLSAADTDGQICVFCHTPHNATPDVPLWNHTLSGNTFTAYDSATMNATDNANWDGDNGTISGLCMSCHDGTIGLGSLINDPPAGAPSNAATTMGAVNGNLGTDLSNDHPVNFTYDGTLQTADTELVDPSTLTGNVLLFGAGFDQVECATCHDPHDNTNAPFLVTTNDASALCLTCHQK